MFQPKLRGYTKKDVEARRQVDRHNDVALRAAEWIEGRVYRSGPQQFDFRDIADGIDAPIEAVREALPHDNANGVTFWLTDAAFQTLKKVSRHRMRNSSNMCH